MSEPGERRRRRELHRNPETGDVQGVAPDPGSGAAPAPAVPVVPAAPARPDVPVSRRAMRGPSGAEETPARGTAADASRSRRSIRDTSLDPTSSRPAPAGSGTPAWSAQSTRRRTQPAGDTAHRPARRTAATGRPPRQAPPSSAPAVSRPPAAQRPAAAPPAPSRPAAPASPATSRPAAADGPAISRPAPTSGAPGQWGQRGAAEPPAPAASGSGWSPAQDRTPNPAAGRHDASARPSRELDRRRRRCGGAGRRVVGDAAVRTAGSRPRSRRRGSSSSLPRHRLPPLRAPPGSRPRRPHARPRRRRRAGRPPSRPASLAGPARSRPPPRPLTPRPHRPRGRRPGSRRRARCPHRALVGTPPRSRLRPALSRTASGSARTTRGRRRRRRRRFDERPRHPYTWLHLIVLALVAFVLGFLIVLLLSNNSKDDAGSTAAAPSVVPVVASAPA